MFQMSAFLFVLISLMMIGIMFQKNHIISVLILLENMVLIMLLYYYFYCSSLLNSFSFLLIIMCLMACEAALGLSMLISMMRLYGNDFLSSMMNLVWFAKNSWDGIFIKSSKPIKDFYLMKWSINFSFYISYTNYYSVIIVFTLYSWHNFNFFINYSYYAWYSKWVGYSFPTC
nr:NADH dehydrogenase subunit 4L [Haplotrema minimum]